MTQSTDTKMTSADFTECFWFNVMLAVRAYNTNSYVDVGTAHTISPITPSESYIENVSGPFYIAKDFQGYVRKIQISNAFGATTDHYRFLDAVTFETSPPRCPYYDTYSNDCILCDRSCVNCVDALYHKCTTGCNPYLTAPDPTSLYPYGTCPEFKCDGRCGLG